MRYSTFCCFALIIVAVRAQTPPVRQMTEPIPPLIEAVWNRDFDRVQQLLAEGADPDEGAQSREGMAPGIG